jgi:hypothetical protein
MNYNGDKTPVMNINPSLNANAVSNKLQRYANSKKYNVVWHPNSTMTKTMKNARVNLPPASIGNHSGNVGMIGKGRRRKTQGKRKTHRRGRRHGSRRH